MAKSEIETTDVPFVRNDIKDYPKTMGKPLDPADGPGKADAEMGEPELEPERRTDAAREYGRAAEFRERRADSNSESEVAQVQVFANACRMLM
jgi:hypothetical protein